MLPKTFLIKKPDQGKRIDKFLKEKLPALSRNFIIRLIQQKKVSINGEKAKPAYRLKDKDRLKINLKKQKLVKISPDVGLVNILFENDDFLILNKPAGISVHRPNKNSPFPALIDALLVKKPEIRFVEKNQLRTGLVHRLDKDTSGLLIVAKNPKSFAALKRLFKQRKIKKTYRAVVHGHLSQKQGRIRSYISRSTKSYQKRINLPYPKKSFSAKKAVTEFKIIKLLKNDRCYTLLDVFPKTGRTHQIRIQLQSINHPIVGDLLYRNKLYPLETNQKLLLHAQGLEFSLKRRYYRFYAPLPERFTNFLNKIQNNND